MTKQLLRPTLVDVTGCHKCGHYWDSGLFELCMHAQSQYGVDGKQDHHTIQHMRGELGKCGPDKRLRSEK